MCSTQSTFALPNGQVFAIRALNEQDEDQVADFLKHVDEDDVRMRFFASISAFDHRFLWPLVHYDHRIGIALAALDLVTEEILGVARLHCTAPRSAGEFAILVRSDRHHQGLGLGLVRQLLEWAGRHELPRVYGEVLRDNHPMLDFCRRLGFRLEDAKDDPQLVIIELEPRVSTLDDTK